MLQCGIQVLVFHLCGPSGTQIGGKSFDLRNRSGIGDGKSFFLLYMGSIRSAISNRGRIDKNQ